MSEIKKLTTEQQDDVFEGNYECCAKALRIIDQQAAECERLRAEIQSSDAGRDAALEMISTTLNERDGVFDALETAESRLAASEAECERLRAELAIAWDDEAETKRANAAESRLAAANALLKQAYNFVCTGKRKADLYEALRAHDDGALWRDCCEDPTPSVDASGQSYCEACDSDIAGQAPVATRTEDEQRDKSDG